MRLFWKIYLGVLVAVFVVLLALSYVLMSQQITFARDHIIDRARILGQILAKEIEPGLAQGKWPFETLHTVAGSRDFLFWWIVRDDGTIHLAEKASFIGTNTNQYSPKINLENKEERVWLNPDENLGVWIFPMQFGRKTWTLWLGFSLSGFTAIKYNITIATVFACLAAMIVLGSIFYLMMRHYDIGFRNLTQGAAIIGTGNLSHRIRIDSNDELGQLAQSFNDMAAGLQETTISRSYFDQILRSTNDGLVVVDSHGVIRSVNEATLTMSGFSEPELLNKPLKILVTPSETNQNLKVIDNGSVWIGQSGPVETRLQTRDGKCLAILLSSARMMNVLDTDERFVVTITDITDRKRAEELVLKSRDELETKVIERTSELLQVNERLQRELVDHSRTGQSLKDREQMLRSILSSSPVGIGFSAMDRNLLWVNEAWLEIFGFQDEKEVVGRNASMLYPSQEEFERVGSVLFTTLEKGSVGETDAQMTRANGEVFRARIRMNPLDSEDLSKGIIATIEDVTQRKQTEEKLIESEARFQAFMTHAPIVALIKDETGRYVYVNNKWLAEFSLFQKDWKGKKAEDVFSPEAAAGLVEADNLVLKHGRLIENTMLLPNNMGTVRHWWTVKFPLWDTEGHRYIGGVALDITELKMAQESLRESEEKYRSVVDGALEAILVIQDGQFRLLNPRAIEISGFQAEELIDRPFLELIHPDDLDMVREHYLQLLKGEKLPPRYSFRIVHKNQTIVWVEADSNQIEWNGRLALLVFITDISERKEMEEKLKEREEWYRSLVENSFDGIFLRQGPRIIFANSRLYEMLGYSPGELDGKNHSLIYYQDDRKAGNLDTQSSISEMEITSEDDIRLQRKDGTTFLAEISARSIKVTDKPGAQVWIKDVSNQRRTEQSQKRLATAVEQAAEGIMITDNLGHIEYINPAFVAITGYSQDEVIGKNPRILQSGHHDRKFYKELWDTIGSGNTWRGEFVNRKKDGTLYREDTVISPVRDSSSRIVNYVAVKRDRTVELELQQQLFWAQKMEGIGTLAGGIAHDFNNLLQVVLGRSEIMLQRKKEGDADYAGIQQIYEAGKRGADLVKSLLTFSRKVEPKLCNLNLNQEILQFQALISRTIPKTIKIELHLNGDLESTLADSSQVGQILMNLAVNARDAMPDGGTLTMVTDNIELDAEYCRRHLGAKAGRYVMLAVSDTGHGMDKETLARVFEPFFTTKEAGKGTGLGLATVYGIVKQHNGYIVCYSEPALGTSFKIYFPAIQPEARLESPVAEPEIVGGTETILLADDDLSVLRLASEILENYGYKVLSAVNGKQALEMYKNNIDRISLSILDLIMPEMDGKRCSSEILKLNPNAKVLIASGYLGSESPDGVTVFGAKGFVEKPYNTKHFLKIVRKVLDEPA